MLRGVNLNLLPILRELLRERNVTAAAKRLNLTQSGVSEALGRLRVQFGDELLVKTGRRMVPTALALEIAPRLEDLLATTDTALGELQLLNLHLRPPISEDGSWVKGYLTTDGARQEEIRRYFKSLDPTLPTIIAGDMNEAASGDVVAFLREQGMESALEEFEPGATTWRWPLPVGSLTWQLDHVAYQTKRLRPLNAQVRRAGNSDHFPVVTVFVKP